MLSAGRILTCLIVTHSGIITTRPHQLLTVRLVSDLVRSPTTHVARRLHVSIASVLYLLPFIIGADLLDQ